MEFQLDKTNFFLFNKYVLYSFTGVMQDFRNHKNSMNSLVACDSHHEKSAIGGKRAQFRYQVKFSEEESAMLAHLANTSRGTTQKVKNALILLKEPPVSLLKEDVLEFRFSLAPWRKICKLDEEQAEIPVLDDCSAKLAPGDYRITLKATTD